MSHFHKYSPSQRGRDHLTRSGFDFDDLRREYAHARNQQQVRTPAPPPPHQQPPGFLDRAKELLLGRRQQDKSRDPMSRAVAWPAALAASISLLGFDAQPAVAQSYGHPSAELTTSPEPLHVQLGHMKELITMPEPDPAHELSPHVAQSIYGQDSGRPKPEIEMKAPDKTSLSIRVTQITVKQVPADLRSNPQVVLWLSGLTFGSALLALAHVHHRRVLRQGPIQPKQAIKEGGENKAEGAELSQPSPWTHTLSIATRQGLARTENQDAVWGQQFAPDCSALIVCDGAGGVAGGREASQQAVRIMSAHLGNQYEAKGGFELADLTRSIELARETNKSTELTGITTALIAVMQGDELIYATLGDGALSLLWPDGMVTHLQALHHTAGQPENIINAFIGHDCQVPPRVGWQKLEPGCLVMLMSDGASDIFPFEDYALNRPAHWQALEAMPEIYADRFLQQLEEARDESGAYLHVDNLSLGLIGLKEVSHG